MKLLATAITCAAILTSPVYAATTHQHRAVALVNRPASAPPASAPAAAALSPAERGKMLVIGGGCHDCHTTKKLGPNGPEPDMSKMLSGHPEDIKITAPFKAAPGSPWTIATYMIAGQGSREQAEARRFAYGDPGAMTSLVDQIVDCTVDYLARQVEAGVEAVLARIPAAERYFITFDADGLDPAIAPGVGSPMFGGLTYFQATNLLKGVAARAAARRAPSSAPGTWISAAGSR